MASFGTPLTRRHCTGVASFGATLASSRVTRSGETFKTVAFGCISLHSLSSAWSWDARFAGYTNEVHHQIKLLPWDTHRSPLRNGVRLPAYVPRAPRSGKSLSLCRSGSRAIDGCSGAEAQRFTHHGLPAVVRAGAVPRASLVRFPGWSGIRLCMPASSNASVGGGRRSRYEGSWNDEAGRTVISYESIYRFIYAQKARHKDHGWRQYLPEAKWKRGRRVRQRSSSVSFILERHSLAERPPRCCRPADLRPLGG